MFYDDREPIKRVFLYLRRSTSESSGKQVRSIEDQREACLQMAERLGLKIIETFSEDKSARKPDQRPEFKKMLKSLSYKSPSKRRADGVLAYHPDRLSRNAKEAGLFIQLLDDQLIKDCFFPAYPFTNHAVGHEHLFLVFGQAKAYTDRLVHIVRRGVQSREAEGAQLYPIRFGYQKLREVPDQPKRCSLFPVPKEEEFEAIKTVFKLALEGHSTAKISEHLKAHFGHLERQFNKASVHQWLNDRFYHGRWIINRDQQDERIIDLLNIETKAGTKFTPVVSESEFNHIQELQSGRTTAPKRYNAERRPNPLPQRVRCSFCGAKLRPAYRKIQFKNQPAKQEQLGFECQGKSDAGKPCCQGRVRMLILNDLLASWLQGVSPNFTKKQHARYLVASKKFVDAKQTELRKGRASASRKKRLLSNQKQKLVESKLALVRAGEYDQAAKQHYEQQIKRIELQMAEIQETAQDESAHTKRQLLTFEKTLELLENLPQLWAAASYDKKAKIAEVLDLNLVVKNQKIQSVSVNPLFLGNKKDPSVGDGGPRPTELEPYLNRLWNKVKALPAEERKKLLRQLNELDELE